MKVVVLGAGVGGKLAALAAKSQCPGSAVTLIGPEPEEPGGLFYFNEKIPGIAEREVEVIYTCRDSSGKEVAEVTDRDRRNYQIKSRGAYSPLFKVSSFDKIGKTEKGYLTNTDFDLSGVCRVNSFVKKIYLESKSVVTSEGSTFEFDKLISTIPLPTFVRISYGVDISSLLNYTPIYIKETIPETSDLSRVTKIIVNYDVQEDSPYYRHSYYMNGDDIIKVSSESIKEAEDYTRKVIPGKLLPSNLRFMGLDMTPDSIEKEYPFLKILGRYARWEYHYLVTDTYKDAIEFLRRDDVVERD